MAGEKTKAIIMSLMKNKLRDLAEDRRGNFAMMVAVVAPLLLAGGGVALDLANQTALKTRFQAASDSVSLATASRIANGDLAIQDAEAFATQLLVAQMSVDSNRFLNLKVEPSVKVVKVQNGGKTTWDVHIGGKATQDTTPFSKFLNKPTTSAVIQSVATAGKEEIQGALSMAVVVDVSGSMGWELPGTTSAPVTAGEVASILKVSVSVANIALSKINDVMAAYKLDYNDMYFIANKYKFSQCKNMSKKANKRKKFFKGIGMNQNGSATLARQICEDATYATSQGVSKGNYKKHVKTLAGAPRKVIKIDALRDAAAALFAQFNAADPQKKYVRTGLTAYSSYIRGTTNMEWGTGSAQGYTSGMYASGGTASTKSVQWAFDQLKSTNRKEFTEHANKNGQIPDRFMLFMTDGDNNRTSDDTSTKKICDSAKADGIEIFSVAFAAPSRGEKLLKYCASSGENYFEPETAEELISAFENIGVKTAKTLTRLTN